MPIQKISDINLKTLVSSAHFTLSPSAWEDQVFYFLLVDRFSDDKENNYHDINGNKVTTGSTPLFTATDNKNAISNEADAAKWREAGGAYVGGTLTGLKHKIGYLKRLGITTIWVSPIFKQVESQQSYHGYGIQNFLQVNPHFGTAQDFKDLVSLAHQHGIFIVLDIILNHVGDVFTYDPNRVPAYKDDKGNFDPAWDGNLYPVAGFNDETGKPTLPFELTNTRQPQAFPKENAAIWPVDFQNPEYYTKKGRIKNFDFDPEFREGDFFNLKDVNHGSGDTDNYVPSRALRDFCEIYKYWIAFSDIDGYRIDTVKHMDPGASRFFGSSIHEFCETIGKENFLLLGEITGGKTFAFDMLELTGLDAALGIDEIPDKMEFTVKGQRDPNAYFSLFRNSDKLGKGTHSWLRNKVATFFNDHDQVSKGSNKARFCADNIGKKFLLNALAFNVTTLGIPCIYYGSEQGFNGHGAGDGADRYIREAMFGGSFGSFESKGRHFFNEDSFEYKELAEILKIRTAKLPLRRGRQYLREISGNGESFGLPAMINGQIKSVVAWSRILDYKEIVLATNTDSDAVQTAWVTVDFFVHNAGDTLTCIYSTDKTQLGKQVAVAAKNGLSVQISVPAAGFVIFE